MNEVLSSPDGKVSNSAALRDLVQTFSDEAQALARKKAQEQGYSLDRGSIPFEETLINLSRDRDILVKSIENSALPQLPLKIQNTLIADAKKVQAHLSALIAGTDAVLPFENAVDELTASIWYSNLQNMAGEVLGLHEKLNQLKILERNLRQLGERSDAFRANEEKIQNGLQFLEEGQTAVGNVVNAINRILQDAQQQFDSLKTSEQLAQASLTVTQQNEKSSAESASTARTGSAEAEANRVRSNTAVTELEQARIGYEAITTQISNFQTQTETTIATAIKTADERENKLLDEIRLAEAARVQASAAQIETSKSGFEAAATKVISETQEGLTATEKRAKKIVDENEEKTRLRFAELEKLENVIREKILLATNFQLFHSFQERQFAIAKGKVFWRNALFTTVGFGFVLAVALIIYLFVATPTYNAAFYLKLSISIPIVYAIHFCSSEYSKERKLEEEYAFKSNISISLEPYRELVEKMIDKGSPTEAAKYSDFVISSIGNVFTSPTQPILGSGVRNAPEDEIADTSKGLAKILGSVNELIQSLTKFK